MGDKVFLVQCQKAVTAYLKSKQLSPYGFVYACVVQILSLSSACLINHRATLHLVLAEISTEYSMTICQVCSHAESALGLGHSSIFDNHKDDKVNRVHNKCCRLRQIFVSKSVL